MKTIKGMVIGDSHTIFLGKPELTVTDSLPDSHFFSQNSPNDAKVEILFQYLGPQLAFSFDAKRFDATHMVEFKPHVLFMYLGEIDIRVHLVRNKNPQEVALRYATQSCLFQELYGIRVNFILPPPPANFGFHDPQFPKNGSLEERLGAHFLFCKTLIEFALDSGASLPLSYSQDYGRSAVDGLSIDMSDDGCHFNQKSNTLLRNQIVESLYRDFGH